MQFSTTQFRLSQLSLCRSPSPKATTGEAYSSSSVGGVETERGSSGAASRNVGSVRSRAAPGGAMHRRWRRSAWRWYCGSERRGPLKGTGWSKQLRPKLTTLVPVDKHCNFDGPCETKQIKRCHVWNLNPYFLTNEIEAIWKGGR